MMNKKGQTLVIFVLMLPVIIVGVFMVIDNGFLYYQKRKIDNNIKSTITYGLEHLDESDLENKLKNILSKNIEFKNCDILIDEGITIGITIDNSYLKKILGSSELTSKYRGYLENEEVVLIKE